MRNYWILSVKLSLIVGKSAKKVKNYVFDKFFVLFIVQLLKLRSEEILLIF